MSNAGKLESSEARNTSAGELAPGPWAAGPITSRPFVVGPPVYASRALWVPV